MATNFPTSVDVLTNPVSNDSLNSPSHSAQHANANDAIEAIEGYLLNGGQGLTLVKKQTIASGVASQSVTDAFSATYNNYKILVSGGVGSTATTLLLKLNGITTGYYTSMVYVPFSGAATVTGINQANVAYFNWAGGISTASIYADIDLQNPFVAKPKVGSAHFLELSTTGNSAASHFYNASTASATGFTIEAFSGTITGGTIYVYGYGVGQ